MADADLTQFNRVAADAEAANAADALTSQLLLITDGKKIVGETNSAGKAPVVTCGVSFCQTWASTG
jgi:hypothetical protein